MADIFIVEDDAQISEIEAIALQNSGHRVTQFPTGRSFLEQMAQSSPDLVLLDLHLPDISGFEILSKLRTGAVFPKVPVLIVSASRDEVDMIRSLDSGADDYIRKPFSVIELITRVKALLRRSEPDISRRSLSLGGICLDEARHTVTAQGTSVRLTFKEYELLRFLLKNAGTVMSRKAILEEIWGKSFSDESRTVDMHIKTLRKKLGEEGKHIRTVRNVGYVIE